MDSPFFSIIIPVYNREDFIYEAIQSVLSQSFKNFELIVVDDASTDNTKRLVFNVCDSRVRYLRNRENRGVSYSRNRGIKNAKGEWIALLDSDDLWDKNKLLKQYNLIKNNHTIRVIHTNEIWKRDGKIVNQKKYHQKKGGDIFEISLFRCMMSPSSIVIHKSVFDKVGYFQEEFLACEDYDLWLKISIYYIVHYIEEPLTIKRGGHKDQLSSTVKYQDRYRVLSLLSIYKKFKFLIGPKKCNLLIEVLKTKLEILETGAIKHNNMELLEFVKNIKSKT